MAAGGPDAGRSPPREVVFHVHGVTKVYRMGEVEVHALRGIDLDLYRGEFMVLRGASGSGKSTLLNILGGLDTPTSGEVQYGGRDLARVPEALAGARDVILKHLAAASAKRSAE